MRVLLEPKLSVQAELFMLQNDVESHSSSKNTCKTSIFQMVSFAWKLHQKRFLWCFLGLKMCFEMFLEFRNDFYPKNVVKSKQNSSTYTWCIRKHSERLWNKRFVGLFQNLKAFSIFKLWSIPLGSESFKPILEASRSRIFDLKLWFSKKIIFLSPTTHFIRNSLTKSASKFEKNSKKMNFFRFFQNGPGFNIWSCEGSQSLWDI